MRTAVHHAPREALRMIGGHWIEGTKGLIMVMFTVRGAKWLQYNPGRKVAEIRQGD
jgi:hypothetical protein